jgi:hypothetical protein
MSSPDGDCRNEWLSSQIRLTQHTNQIGNHQPFRRIRLDLTRFPTRTVPKKPDSNQELFTHGQANIMGGLNK